MTEPAPSDDGQPGPDRALHAPRLARVGVALVVTVATAACIVLVTAVAPTRTSQLPMIAAPGPDRIGTPPTMPAGTAAPGPDDADVLARLKAAVLPRRGPLLDSGTSVHERLAVNCTANTDADSSLVLAIRQRWTESGVEGQPDVTVAHMVAAYDDSEYRQDEGEEAVGAVSAAVTAECATYVTPDGSTWAIDSQRSWADGWDYCARVIVPAGSLGYTCTGYHHHRDLVSRLTVTAPAGAPEATRDVYDRLMNDAANSLTGSTERGHGDP